MKAFFLVLMLLLSSLAQAMEYEFKKSGYRFQLDWVSGPSTGESKFVVRSWHPELRTDTAPYQDLPHKLHIYLWMPEMGHGSAPVKISQLASGVYEVSSVYFIMNGLWEVHVELLQQNDVVDEVSLSIPL